MPVTTADGKGEGKKKQRRNREVFIGGFGGRFVGRNYLRLAVEPDEAVHIEDLRRIGDQKQIKFEHTCQNRRCLRGRRNPRTYIVEVADADDGVPWVDEEAVVLLQRQRASPPHLPRRLSRLPVSWRFSSLRSVFREAGKATGKAPLLPKKEP
jgi:hypothetical protein